MPFSSRRRPISRALGDCVSCLVCGAVPSAHTLTAVIKAKMKMRAARIRKVIGLYFCIINVECDLHSGSCLISQPKTPHHLGLGTRFANKVCDNLSVFTDIQNPRHS